MAEVNEYFPSGNTARDTVILQAIAEAGETATLEEIYEHVPEHIRATFGALLPEEVSQAKQWTRAAAEARHGDTVEHADGMGEISDAAVQVEPTISRDEILSTIASLTQAIGRERGELLRLQSAHGDARRALADAIMAFQTKRPALTHEQLVRQEIAANQEYRRAVAEGRAEPRRRPARVLRSAIDAMAAATAETGQRAGGGLSFRRGATTLRGRRVPSER